VNYQDFKVVETNLRAAHDAIRALAQGVKDLNETIARQTGLIQQLQFRLSRVEARVYGEEPKDAA
jgi:hypothetical protein